MIVKEYKNSKISAAVDIVQIVNKILWNMSKLDREKEMLFVVGLNVRLNIQFIDITSIGTSKECNFGAKEIFRTLIFHNSDAFILLHQHPSGNPDPSGMDDDMTHRLKDVAKMIGMQMVDHIIIGLTEEKDMVVPYYSYVKRGLLHAV